MPDYTRAIANLEQIHPDLDSRTAFIIKTLIKAGLPCREYDTRKNLENLADAVYHLWKHLCTLDPGNLTQWDISIHQLVSFYGSAIGAQTFPTTNTTTPEQAYERLKSLEADLDDLYLKAPAPGSDINAIEEYEEQVMRTRAAIFLLSDYASDAPPDLDKPF